MENFDIKRRCSSCSTPQCGLLNGWAIKNSWEDEDRNRHYPLGGEQFLVKDGGDGYCRGIVKLNEIEALALKKY